MFFVDEPDNVLCFIYDVGHVNPDDMSRTCSSGEHAENASAAADVEHDLVFEHLLGVARDTVAVELGAHAVLEHFFVNAEMAVARHVRLVLVQSQASNGVGRCGWVVHRRRKCVRIEQTLSCVSK